MRVLFSNHIYEFVVSLMSTNIDLFVPDNAKRQKVPHADRVHIVPDAVTADCKVAAEYIDRNKIDIVYAQGRQSMSYYYKVKQLLKGKHDFKIIVAAHTGYIWEVWWKSLALLAIARMQSDGLVFFAYALQKRYGWFAKLIGLRTWVVRHPVEMKRFPVAHDYTRSEGGRIRLGYVGIITPNKNQNGLIEAFKTVIDKGYDVHLTLVGDVEYEWYHNKLITLISELGLSNRVEIVPGMPYNDIPGFMYSIDCYVCPSKIEVLPLNILEAMGSGLPIVSTNVGGISDLVIGKENGILVPNCSSESLSQGILGVISDRKMLKKYGLRSRQLAQETLSDEVFVDEMTKVFTEVMVYG